MGWLARFGLIAVLVSSLGCAGGEEASSSPVDKPDGGGGTGGCATGTTDCDGDPKNGCETQTGTDPKNCGGCGKSCGLAHAQSSCVSGACEIKLCEPGYADCDGTDANGCETNTAGDLANCGKCGNQCPSGNGLNATCNAGVCGTTTCATPLADCDGDATNGCETTLNDDADNCGSCGNACSYQHGTGSCSKGQCALDTCDAGWDDCDGNATNGCETSLQASNTDCGACGYACSSTNGQSSCQNGQCTVACQQGFGNCDNIASNGCETTLSTSVNNCGGCGIACGSVNGTATCTSGECKITCLQNYADCDGQNGNGCETNLLVDPNNCGACTTACPVPVNGVQACFGGICGVGACNAPYANCDGLAANGCETNLNTNANHCAGCGNACPKPTNGSAVCTSGVCGFGSCTLPFADCNASTADGCEVNTSSDPAHCGACNNACSYANAAGTCAGGNCSLGTCTTGFANCNGNAGDGCEINTQTSPQHCGGCNNDCGALIPNANTSCNGTCSFVSCKTGFWNIDSNTANGCEYACTFQSAADLPDDTFADANCDGIDGVVADAIFVSKAGNDSWPGTMAQPKLTVNAGVTAAIAASKTQVYVSEGTYFERVSLGNGVSIYGGYSANNGWKRSGSYTSVIRSNSVIGGRVTAVDGSAITSPTTLDRLTIRTDNATAPGVSNYAFYCNGCTGVTLKNSVVEAGSGGAGVAGGNGTDGASGSPGGGGNPGSCDANVSGGAGGPGGYSPCGRTGGNGGKGGDYGSNAGQSGGPGVSGVPGGAGGGGGDPGKAGGPGSTGAAGVNGSNGGAGIGGSAASGLWVGFAGGSGTSGTHGNGGGGGGGGGGQGCFFCNDGPGNGGGGGGGGGCLGTSGLGGSAGGGSFGLFLVSSTGFTLVNNQISSANGGNGGGGGVGGTGGSGGGPGFGAQVCTSEVGGGGNGGTGTKGGNGGHGGGGAGGPTYAVYRVGTTVSVTGNVLVYGSPGFGGSSLGNPGATGSAGTTN